MLNSLNTILEPEFTSMGFSFKKSKEATSK